MDSSTQNEGKGINHDTTKNITSGGDVACTLTDAKLFERKEKLVKEIFSDVTEIQEIDTGFIFNFKYEENFILKLTDYILAENKCCPFFQFDIRLKAKNDVLLKITGPPKAKLMVKTLLLNLLPSDIKNKD